MSSLAGLCAALFLTAVPLPAQKSATGGLDLGRQWKVHQWILPTVDLDGRWTRIGKSNTFDVDYTNKANGQHVYARVKVLTHTTKTIVLLIEGSQVKMVGNIGLDGQSIRGRLDPCPAGNTCGWTAETDWQPPPAVAARHKTATRALSLDDLGKVWRVHDFTTEGYDYYGTWTLPSSGEAIEFVYKNKKDGVTAKGSLTLGTITGREITIFNSGRRKWMRGVVQADGKTIKGSAEWCRDPNQCGWEATVVR